MSEKLNPLSHAIFLLPNITELRTSTQIPWRSCTLPVSSSFCLDLVSPPKMDLRKKRTLSRFRAEHNIQSLASGDWYNYGKSGKHAKDYYVEDHRRVATAFKTNKSTSLDLCLCQRNAYPAYAHTNKTLLHKVCKTPHWGTCCVLITRNTSGTHSESNWDYMKEQGKVVRRGRGPAGRRRGE